MGWLVWLGIGLVTIAVGVGIYLLVVAHKQTQALLQHTRMFYRCRYCGLPFIASGDYHLPTCSNCGQTTNISGQEPFSKAELDHTNWLQSLDKNKPETWVFFALELDSKGRYAEAMKCIKQVDKFPNVDENIIRTADVIKDNLKRRGY